MPIKVVCPTCGHSLTAPDHFAGKVAGCPSCKTKIQVPAGDSTASAAPPRPAPPRPAAPPAGGPPRPAPTARPAPPRPAARPPAPAAPAGDQFDFLGGGEAAGGHDAGFDFMSGPPSPAPAGAAPPGRPPLPLKQKKKNSLLLPIIAGVSLVALIGAGVAGWMLLGNKGGGGGSILRYLPDNADVAFRVDMAGVLNSGFFKKVQATVPEAASLPKVPVEGVDLSPNDIAEVYGGGNSAGKDFVAFVRFRQPRKPTDFMKNAKTEKVGEHTLYVEGDNAAAAIDASSFVVGPGNAVRAVLKRNGDAKVSADLKTNMSGANFGATVAFAMAGKSLSSSIPKQPGAPMPINPADVDGINLSATVGADIDLRVQVSFKDANKAAAAKAQADASLQMGQALGAMAPNLGKAISSMSVSQSGSVLSAKAYIPAGVIDDVQKMMSSGPGGGGPPF